MAKTAAPEPMIPDEAAIAAMVDAAVEEKMAAVPALIQDILNGIVDSERENFKRWARREIGLNACGASESERGELNQ